MTAPCRRPTGQSFLNTEPGARAQSYISCSTDTLLWGASGSIALSIHDWRLDWDMFVAAFACRRSRFCVHLHNGSETIQPRPFSVFAFNYDVFVWLPVSNDTNGFCQPILRHSDRAFVRPRIYINFSFWLTFIGCDWKILIVCHYEKLSSGQPQLLTVFFL